MTDETHLEDGATETLPDPVEEDSEIDKPDVTDPEDELLECEDSDV